MRMSNTSENKRKDLVLPRKKSENRQRTEYIRARVTPEEKAIFVKYCSDSNLTTGDYIRSKCCGVNPERKVQVRRPDQKLLSKILAQLGRDKNNINQVAHALNIAKLERDYSASAALFHLKRFEKQIADMQTKITDCHALVMKTLLEDDTVR